MKVFKFDAIHSIIISIIAIFAIFLINSCAGTSKVTQKQLDKQKELVLQRIELSTIEWDDLVQREIIIPDRYTPLRPMIEPSIISRPHKDLSHTLSRVQHRVIHYVDNKHLSGKAVGDRYNPGKGIFTFRGGLKRDMPVTGKIKGVPQKFEIDWVFRTNFNTTTTRFGTWGGGLGWTGQPLLVVWPDSLRRSFDALSDDFKLKHGVPEVIIGSLSGTVFFLDFETGKETRPPISTDNPIKGTPSLDPRFNGMLYVGDGVPHNDRFGIHFIDLFKHEKVYFYSGHTDPVAYRRWGAFDSSPVFVGDYLYWTGENGVLYKFCVNNDSVNLISKMVYRVNGKPSLGIESSLAVYKNYGYFGDNHGNIFCVNLITMELVWYYDNIDDTDATIVLEVEDGMPYIYTGCQVDKQPDEGYSYFTKLNGLDGTQVWTNKVRSYAVYQWGRRNDGGLFATPLLGRYNAKDLIITNFTHTQKDRRNGELIAFYKSTGEIAYRTSLNAYSWSSPVALYNKEGDLYIFTGDVVGNAYIIDGSNGQIIYKRNIGNNFEASPIAWGNNIIIGSRGREIYKLTIK